MPKINNKNCDSCGVLYKNQNKRFCSSKCMYKTISIEKTGIKRPKLSEDWKRKIGLSSKGRKHNKETLLKMKSRVVSLETRRKISASKKGTRRLDVSIRQVGANNPSWKGGVSTIHASIRGSIEYKLWRKSVFERDKYKCVWCGISGYLQADHIKPFALFPELRFAIDNGRTLCVPCHKTTDTYGRKK